MYGLITSTPAEFDTMEIEYEKTHKNLRPKYEPINISTRLGNHEQVIFFYYKPQKIGFSVYILTNIKFIFSPSDLAQSARDLPLKTLTGVHVFSTWFVKPKGIIINNNELNRCLLFITEEPFIQNICDQITKAKANYETAYITNPDGMNNTLASTASPIIANQLAKLADLHTSGVLTDEEFARAKQRIHSS